MERRKMERESGITQFQLKHIFKVFKLLNIKIFVCLHFAKEVLMFPLCSSYME